MLSVESLTRGCTCPSGNPLLLPATHICTLKVVPLQLHSQRNLLQGAYNQSMMLKGETPRLARRLGDRRRCCRGGVPMLRRQYH